jgi:hypothetical protein
MDDGGKQVSWLVAEVRRVTFPGRQSFARSSGLDARRTTYSCGGSPGFTPEFPFESHKGNLSRAARMSRGRFGVKRTLDPL